MEKRQLTYLIPGLLILTILIVLVWISPKEAIIIVGTETPPFEFYEDGELRGIDIEFLDKIFTKLDLKYKIELSTWEEAIEKMKDGRGDLILGASYTKEREKFISYRDEQVLPSIGEDALWLTKEIYFYKEKNSGEFDLSSYDAIMENNYKVGLVKSYAYFPELFEHNLNYYSFKTSKELMEGLDDEKVDIAIIDAFEGKSMIQELGLQETISNTKESLNSDANYLLFSKKYSNIKYAYIKNKFYEELIRLKEEENLHNELYLKYTGQSFDEVYELN